MAPGTAGGPCHRLWLAGASPGLPRGTWGTVQTRQRAGLARPRARPSPAPRSAWRLPAGVDADSRALCAVSARGRARRTRGQSGRPAREWSAHWASPGAGGGGRGGCRPVSLQGRGESSWRGGPVVARRPGAGGSEGANVRSPWEVTQPLLRVRQPLSGSCRRQALVPRQRLVLTPDPVLALPARGRSRELCRPRGRFQELSGNAEAAKGLAFEEGPAGHVGAGSRDEGRGEGPLGTRGARPGAMGPGPSRRPWGGCPQTELDARTGAPGLRGSGRAERGGLLAGEGAACPRQRLPGGPQCAPSPQPGAGWARGPRLSPVTAERGARVQKAQETPRRRAGPPSRRALRRLPTRRRRTPGPCEPQRPPTPGGRTSRARGVKRSSSPFLLHRWPRFRGPGGEGGRGAPCTRPLPAPRHVRSP